MDWIGIPLFGFESLCWPTSAFPKRPLRPPDALDVMIVEATYGVIVGDSTCSRCDQPLGARIRVTVDVPWSWPRVLSVAATCTGWRRHRHTAAVRLVDGDLLLGELVPR